MQTNPFEYDGLVQWTKRQNQRNTDSRIPAVTNQSQVHSRQNAPVALLTHEQWGQYTENYEIAQPMNQQSASAPHQKSKEKPKLKSAVRMSKPRTLTLVRVLKRWSLVAVFMIFCSISGLVAWKQDIIQQIQNSQNSSNSTQDTSNNSNSTNSNDDNFLNQQNGNNINENTTQQKTDTTQQTNSSGTNNSQGKTNSGNKDSQPIGGSHVS